MNLKLWPEKNQEHVTHWRKSQISVGNKLQRSLVETKRLSQLENRFRLLFQLVSFGLGTGWAFREAILYWWFMVGHIWVARMQTSTKKYKRQGEFCCSRCTLKGVLCLWYRQNSCLHRRWCGRPMGKHVQYHRIRHCSFPQRESQSRCFLPNRPN